MDGVKWIKICTDIFEDEKIMLIEDMPNGDSIFICWQKLLCLAGKLNNSGVFMINGKIPYTAEMLATNIRRPVKLMKQALEIFVSLGMVEIVDGVYTIPKWEKHQNLDALETAREKNRQRVAAFRAKQKRVAGGNVTSNVTSNVTCNDYVMPCVMVCNGVDKEIEIEEEKDNKLSKKKSFVPPTLEEVQAYASQRGREDLAKPFFDFFEAGDWHDSNGAAVKNWKQKFVTWEQHNAPKKKQLYATPKVYSCED